MAACDVRRVARDPGSDDAVLDILNRRQPQVLRGRHIAEEVRPGHACHGAADGGADMVVAG